MGNYGRFDLDKEKPRGETRGVVLNLGRGYMAQNTLALERLSSEEGKTDGQTRKISEPSVFWFPVYEGIFEHAPILKDAVWLFMWLVASTTRDQEGREKVLGGIPIPDDRPAAELNFPVKTVRRWRRMLQSSGYINLLRTPYGFRYTLLKSKKWQKPTPRELPKRAISESARNGQRDLPPWAERVPEMGRESARSGKYKEDDLGVSQRRDSRREGSAAASPVSEKPKTERNPEPWEAIGIEPCGLQKFTSAWEGIHRDRLDGEPLSATMERAIQHCQENSIRVPPPFFSAKRAVEESESKAKTDNYPRLQDFEARDAKLGAELKASREAKDAIFNALPQEEKLAKLKAQLAAVEEFILSVRKPGEKVATWILDSKADLERKMREAADPGSVPKTPSAEAPAVSS